MVDMKKVVMPMLLFFSILEGGMVSVKYAALQLANSS